MPTKPTAIFTEISFNVFEVHYSDYNFDGYPIRAYEYKYESSEPDKDGNTTRHELFVSISDIAKAIANTGLLKWIRKSDYEPVTIKRSKVLNPDHFAKNQNCLLCMSIPTLLKIADRSTMKRESKESLVDVCASIAVQYQTLCNSVSKTADVTVDVADSDINGKDTNDKPTEPTVTISRSTYDHMKDKINDLEYACTHWQGLVIDLLRICFGEEVEW